MGWVMKDTQSCVLVYTYRYISVYAYTHKKLWPASDYRGPWNKKPVWRDKGEPVPKPQTLEQDLEWVYSPPDKGCNALCVCHHPPTHTHRGTNYLHFACINAEANSSHLVLSSGVMRVCHEQSPSVEHLTVKTPGNHTPELQGLYISSARGIDCKGQTGSPSTPHPHSLVPFDLSWGPCRLSGLGLGVTAMCSYTCSSSHDKRCPLSQTQVCSHPVLYLVNYLYTFVTERKNGLRASKVYR